MPPPVAVMTRELPRLQAQACYWLPWHGKIASLGLAKPVQDGVDECQAKEAAHAG